MTLRKLLEVIEFDYTYNNGIFKLVDCTGANLADIESEEFYSVEDMLERLDNYWFDYIFPDKESEDYGKYQTLEDIMNDKENGWYKKEIYAILNPNTIIVEETLRGK